MTKLDLKKELRDYYQPSAKHCSVVEVPEWNFLMIDGHGDPNTSAAYREAMEALYPVSYTLKFFSKQELGIDYTVMALEGLWWADDMDAFPGDDKDSWNWMSMIMQPDHLTEEHVAIAIDEVRAKKNPPALDRLRFEPFREGTAVQIMHIGPYDAEAPTIARLHEFAHENGYRLTGRHHEIYLGDPRRTAPERLRTVIRQPVER